MEQLAALVIATRLADARTLLAEAAQLARTSAPSLAPALVSINNELASAQLAALVYPIATPRPPR